jgi:hypothetical protein
MVKVAKSEGGVEGVVFGRVDFAGSNNLPRSEIDSDTITNYIVETARICKDNALDLVVGGAVSIDSLEELRKIKQIHLTRFETRKVIFIAEALDNPKIEHGLEQTIYFELLWLKNKRDYYSAIENEDKDRIAMLEQRWSKLRSA